MESSYTYGVSMFRRVRGMLLRKRATGGFFPTIASSFGFYAITSLGWDLDRLVCFLLGQRIGGCLCFGVFSSTDESSGRSSLFR